MDSQNTIAIHKREWSRTESIERIASRFFIIGEESTGRYSWVVEARSGFSNNDAITDLNEELAELGLIGTLNNADPPTLSIVERSYGSGILPNWQIASVWAFSIMMMLFAGSTWANKVGAAGNPYAQSAFFYVLPMTSALFIASEVKRRLNEKAGIKSGHLIPLAMPQISAFWWPFGLFGLLSQRNPEHTPIPSRKHLARIEISVPAILFISGQPLVLAGLLMTPSNPPPDLAAAPLTYYGSIAPNLASSIFIGPDLAIRLQWIHPLGLAGLSLSILAWLLMLPIPGLPGDRLLSALLGRDKHTDMTTQNTLFVLSLGVLISVFVSTEFIPWLVIATIACMRRFGSDQLTPPMVVNMSEGFPRESLERYTAAAIVILLLGLPGMLPSSEFENWDKGLDRSEWPSSVLVDEEQEIEIQLSPLGAEILSGEIYFEIDDPSNSGWGIYGMNGSPIEHYRFDGVMQSEQETIHLSIKRNSSSTLQPHPARIIMTVDDGKSVSQNQILVTAPSQSAPYSSSWMMATNSTVACLDIETTKGNTGTWSVNDPFWASEEVTPEEGTRRNFCITPLPGAIEGAERDDRRRALGPQVTFVPDDDPQNGTKHWRLPILGSEPWISGSNREITLPEWMVVPNATIVYGADQTTPSCILTESLEPHTFTVERLNWSIETSPLLLPSEQVEINLRLPSDGWIAICDGHEFIESLRIRDGPGVMLSGTPLGLEITEATIGIINADNASIPLLRDWSGDAPSLDVWSISAPDSLVENETTTITVTPENGENSLGVFWISTTDEAVVLNFAARCPSGGCGQ